MSNGSKNPERVRTLYISSENVDYFESSERVTINLRETVTAQDDYELCYALKSIGFNSTAMNISHKQKNNSLLIEIEYDYTNVLYDQRLNTTPAPNGGDPSPKFIYVQHSTTTEKRIRNHVYYVPDGHYTLEELFNNLSTSAYQDNNTKLLEFAIIDQRHIIPSGYFRDAEEDQNDVSNIISISIVWNETDSGFIIQLQPQPINNNNIRTEYNETLTPIPYSQIFPSIRKVRILPNPINPGLYDLLFTNYNTDLPQTPISVPNYRNVIRGLNPPKGVEFQVTLKDLMDPLNFNPIKIVEIGNESIYHIPNGIYPNEEKINYMNYIAYYKPVLDPIYVDIEISLPTIAMDEEGQKNLLARIYTLGAKDGNSSLFQAWDNPKKNVVSGSHGFSSIALLFKSQEDKWNFFNLEFTMELEIFEQLEEQTGDSVIQDVQVPESDPISAVDSSLPQNHHLFSNSHFPYRTAGVHALKKGRYF